MLQCVLTCMKHRPQATVHFMNTIKLLYLARVKFYLHSAKSKQKRFFLSHLMITLFLDSRVILLKTIFGYSRLFNFILDHANTPQESLEH